MNTRHIKLQDVKYCDGCPFHQVNSFNQRISYCNAMISGLGREMHQEMFQDSYLRTRRQECPLPVVIMPPEEGKKP